MSQCGNILLKRVCQEGTTAAISFNQFVNVIM